MAAAADVVFNSVPFGLLVSAAIAASASALLIVIDPIARRLHPALRWTVWIATFVAAAVAGTWVAAALLVVIDAAPRERVLVVFSQNIAGTIPTSIVVGTFIMTIDAWTARVQAAQAALQTARFDRERAERLAAEARLASLSARVQPHVLFNTLNAIAALVRDDPRRAEQMVEQLSGVLRTSLDTATTVPVEREMKLVDDYLRIQQTRLGDRLRFEHHAIDPSIAELEQRLPSRRWLRIHRATLVNMDAVKELHAWFSRRLLLRMQDGTELHVARDRAAEVRATLGL